MAAFICVSHCILQGYPPQIQKEEFLPLCQMSPVQPSMPLICKNWKIGNIFFATEFQPELTGACKKLAF